LTAQAADDPASGTGGRPADPPPVDEGSGLGPVQGRDRTRAARGPRPGEGLHRGLASRHGDVPRRRRAGAGWSSWTGSCSGKLRGRVREALLSPRMGAGGRNQGRQPDVDPQRRDARLGFQEWRERRTTWPGRGRSGRPEGRRNRSRRRRNHHRVRLQYRAGEWPCRFTTGVAFAPTDFTIFIKRGPPTWPRH